MSLFWELHQVREMGEAKAAADRGAQKLDAAAFETATSRLQVGAIRRGVRRADR